MIRRVVVTDYTFPNLKKEQAAAQAAGAEFQFHQCRSAEEVTAAVKDAYVAVVQFAPMSEKAIAGLAPGAAVLRYGIGYDNIDIPALVKAEIPAGYVPDYCTSEVADHTVASLLHLVRKLSPLDQSVRQGKWNAVEISKPLKPFDQCLIGFFGYGQIGRSVHKRLIPFGFKFAVTDPGLSSDEAKKLEINKISPEELFSTSDIVCLHAPASGETIEYVNAKRLKIMRSHSVIINTARGALINEADLAEALHRGQIAGAALDVFHTEPLPHDSPLRSAPNLLLTPHAAWYSDGAIDRLQGLIAQDITNHLNGIPLRKPIPGT